MPERQSELYLNLLKKTLTNIVYEDAPNRTRFVKKPYFDLEQRMNGEDWPVTAHTMIGMRRLDNIQECVETVLADGVPGDLIETGVWRGGACIFMRGVLAAHGVTDRLVWVADSFEGMPHTDDDGNVTDKWLKLDDDNDILAVSQETVQENFARYDLLDDQVRFIKGWFCDSLPNAPVERLAVLRLDGDLYDSTMDSLVNLYPKVAPGGFVIIDDFVIPSCRQAVEEFRAKNDITEPIREIDNESVYWRVDA